MTIALAEAIKTRVYDLQGTPVIDNIDRPVTDMSSGDWDNEDNIILSGLSRISWYCR